MIKERLLRKGIYKEKMVYKLKKNIIFVYEKFINYNNFVFNSWSVFTV
jgi:hypothetical protein